MKQWNSPFGPRTTADRVLDGLDVTEQNIVITGANVGIGFETARALAAHGAKVTLACRDAAKGDTAAEKIRKKHPNAKVDVRTLDLASLESVRAFAADLPDPSIDVLIANAGVFGGDYRETEEGIEWTVGVCHVGHFLLADLLLERLEAGGGGRVVLVSSEGHKSPSTLDWDRFPLELANFKPMVAYGQAKLCNILHAKELQRRYGERGISAYSLHPGTLVPTAIGRHSLVARLLIQAIRPFTKSLGQGAATSVLCAVHPDVADLGGEYFSDCTVARPSREAETEETAQRLWERSEEWVA